MPPRPFIPVANTASLEFIYSNAAELNENVIHVQKGSPFSLSDLQALRGVANTWDGAYNCNLRTAGAYLIRIRTKALDNSSSATEDYYLPTPRNGVLGASAATGLNCAFCLKLATGLAGRSFRGRWYAGNLNGSQLFNAGHLYAASVSAFVAGLTALKTALDAAGYTWVITSFMSDGAWRAAGLNTAVTTIVAVDDAVDSQRRRLPGRGHP